MGQLRVYVAVLRFGRVGLVHSLQKYCGGTRRAEKMAGHSSLGHGPYNFAAGHLYNFLTLF